MATENSNTTTGGIGCGGIGVIIAALLSWGVEKSIVWTAVHACFGWFYVLWYVMSGHK